MKIPRLALCLFMVLCFSACGGGSGSTDPLPTGEQEISGILKQAEISVSRRGTHTISIDGVDTYFAESALVSLRKYQGKRVTLRGTLERNISETDLPVLSVSSVVDVEETAEEHVFTTLGLTLHAPVEWSASKVEEGLSFSVEDIEPPVVVIQKDSSEELPEGGVPVVIDATRATRFIDELTGAQIISVKRPDGILSFHFHPHGSVREARLREDFLLMMQSVHFHSEEAQSSEPSTSTGSDALGVPCGGPAGVLCPQGEYCEVEDLVTGIGRCVQIR